MTIASMVSIDCDCTVQRSKRRTPLTRGSSEAFADPRLLPRTPPACSPGEADQTEAEKHDRARLGHGRRLAIALDGEQRAHQLEIARACSNDDADQAIEEIVRRHRQPELLVAGVAGALRGAPGTAAIEADSPHLAAVERRVVLQSDPEKHFADGVDAGLEAFGEDAEIVTDLTGDRSVRAPRVGGPGDRRGIGA